MASSPHLRLVHSVPEAAAPGRVARPSLSVLPGRAAGWPPVDAAPAIGPVRRRPEATTLAATLAYAALAWDSLDRLLDPDASVGPGAADAALLAALPVVLTACLTVDTARTAASTARRLSRAL